MKKIIAIIGTPSRKATYLAVREFEKNLKQYGEIDFEYVFLSDFRLEFCRGCKVCFAKGEEYCPAKDDRDVLLEKIENSDGVILATPTYAYQVTARMKNFLDRTAYINHRPKYFGKTCTTIITHGLPYGGGGVLKYLSFAAENLGFKVTKGCSITALDPITPNQKKKLIREIKKASVRFYNELGRPLQPPSYLRLIGFRFARANIRNSLTENSRDYRYYKEKGCFESDYFYPTSLGPLKKLAGNFFDFLGIRMARSW